MVPQIDMARASRLEKIDHTLCFWCVMRQALQTMSVVCVGSCAILPQNCCQRGCADTIPGVVEQLPPRDAPIDCFVEKNDFYSRVITSSRFKIIDATNVHAATSAAVDFPA